MILHRRTREKFEAAKKDRMWFAWFPTRTVHGELVWLQRIITWADMSDFQFEYYLRWGPIGAWRYRLPGTTRNVSEEKA
ncbi:MAG: hypothetical protein ACXABY_31340 [Candidatus Thorarchaeota archaeon]|jgi:hypothetical protein